MKSGDVLPAQEVEVTRTLIVAGALASRDFAGVHHDVELAREQGAQDIFMNILTTNGLVVRFVTDWAGRGVVLRAINLKLGVPNFPGDTMHLSGTVTKVNGKDAEIEVRGANSMGDHVVATVEVTTP